MARVIDFLLDAVGYIALACASVVMVIIATASFFIFLIRAGKEGD